MRTSHRLGVLHPVRLAQWLIGLCLACWVGMGAWAQGGLAPVPALTQPVLDLAQVLTTAQRDALIEKLLALERERGAQVVVLLVNSTEPEDIAAYANRIANTWKIGRREVGDGVLVVVAVQDRKLRIEVAKTLEGAIPDLQARRIIDQHIKPHFKSGDYAAGLNAGVDQLAALIRAEALPAPTASSTPARSAADNTGFDTADWAIFLFFAVPIAAQVLRNLMGNRLGALATGGAAGALAYNVTASVLIAGLASVLALFVALVVSSRPTLGLNAPKGGWRGSRTGGFGGGGSWGGGSSGGSDSWGSGGGGDFGGGGASGDW
ncbi:MAG: TPM domain-containing protein [Rhodoferax sp.]